MVATRVSGVEVSADHWIDGRRVPSANRFLTSSPVDGSPLMEVAAGGQVEADAAVAAARRAFPRWAALGPEGRLPILRRFADGIRARAADLAAVETADNGSLLSVNTSRIMPRAAQNISFFAEFATQLDHRIDGAESVNHIRHDPSGVSVLITPWNAPFMLTTWKVGPCLAAGNTAVVKPPEWAPLTCSLLADIAREAGVPAGVLNVVQGLGSEAGAALTRHPDIDRISFTGSTATARLIGAAAAHAIVPVSMELGGKSPLIVCADADLDAAADAVVRQYANAGQVCLAGTRIIVERSIADTLLERVRERAARLVVGDPRDPATNIGPLITPQHFARVEGFVERAKQEGARVLWGGERSAAGAQYFQPTMFADAAPDFEISQNEVFGPVLTWQTFGSDDELVEMANNTAYGLAGSLFCRDEARAMRLAERITAGTFWINCFYVRELSAPFGGAKKSGIGREGGQHSFDFYCNIKNIVFQKAS